jgi:glucosamine--fructose-6-phosphate aminotransferase (isomerizing)
MLREIEEQARLLKDNAASLYSQCVYAVGKDKPQLVVLAARGSSDNACIYGKYLFEIELQIPASLAAPSVITVYDSNVKYPPSLFIGISQSAEAPDVAAVLAHASGQGHRTVSITNRESGPVVDAAKHHIFLSAGQELSVAATKTFTLTLLALYQLSRALGAKLPEPVLGEAAEPADAEVASVSAAEMVFALGRGYQFSAALEAALKLMECALIPCKPFSFADFAHGPIALAGTGCVAISFGSTESDRTAMELEERLAGAGATLLRAPNPEVAHDSLSVFAAAVWAQRLAYKAALARGYDPDLPPHLDKITRTR